jgi:hypothetical protein
VKYERRFALQERFDMANSLVPPDTQRHAAAFRAALLLWLTLNGMAALTLIADPMARFKVFLNPLAPALVVILEVLIVLVSVMRYRRRADLRQ